MKQLVWRVKSSSSESVLTGGSGVPPLQENGVVQILNKRRDAASPSHDCCSKHGFYREIARYPLATADETIDIDRRLEKGESVELALDGEKEVAALNVWRGEREKPLDPFDGPRDYGCTLKVEAFDGAAWHAVGDVRCPTLRARDVRGFLRGFACPRIPGYSATVIDSGCQQRCASTPVRTGWMSSEKYGRRHCFRCRQGHAPPLAVFFAPCRGSRPCRVAEHIR